MSAEVSSAVGWGAFAMDHMLTLENPFKELNIVDYGDAPTDMLSTERTVRKKGIDVKHYLSPHTVDDGRK